MQQRRFIRTLQNAALTLGLGLVSAGAFAQAAAPAAAAPAIPPTWAQGRTPDQMALNLTPNPPGMTALPASEIPTQNLKAPAGFKVEPSRCKCDASKSYAAVGKSIG